MKKALIGFVMIIVCQGLLAQTAQANILVSPYYRYFFPSKDDNASCRTLDTISYGGHRITLFTKDRAHQFGVKTETKSMIVQTIERRPFTARHSISDDGRIFQYWELDSVNDQLKVLFGYTTDSNVVKVQLKLDKGVRQIRLYDGRYFFCVLNPFTDELLEAQGINTDGKILRTWNGQFNYPARRSWLSFFVQTYPYVVSHYNSQEVLGVLIHYSSPSMNRCWKGPLPGFESLRVNQQNFNS